MRNKIWRCGSTLLLLLLLCLLLPAALAAADENASDSAPMLRIGYNVHAGMFTDQDKGQVSGYVPEYMNKIAAITSWRYEWVEMGWEQQLEALANGEIDLVCHAKYSPPRAERFLYSHWPLGYTYAALYVLADNDAYCLNEFTAFDGMHLGLVRNAYEEITLTDFAATNHFNYYVTHYADDVQALTALRRGQVDGVVLSHQLLPDNTKAVAKFSVQPYYIVVRPQSEALMQQINQAMETIKIETPYIESDLYQRNFSADFREQTLSYTREEMEYLAKAPALTVGISGTRPSIYWNEQEQKYDGIFIGIMDQLAAITGLHFDYQPLAEDMSILEALQDERYALVVPLAEDTRHLTNAGLASAPLISTSLAFAAPYDFRYHPDTPYTIGIIASLDNLSPALAQVCPGCTIKRYATTGDCLHALLNSEIDLMAHSPYSLSYLLLNPRYQELVTLVEPTLDMTFSIGMNPALEPVAASILTKGAAELSPAETQSIILQYTGATAYEYSLSDFIYKNRVALGAILLALLLLALCLLIWRNRQRLKQKANIDGLSGLLNRITLEERVQQLLHQEPVDCAFLLYDLDNFKAINDHYGHAEGDRLLKQVAAALQSNFRQNDLVARLGGDEFMVVLNHVGSRGRATSIAQRTLEEIAAIGPGFGWEQPTSASLGLAFAPDDGCSFQELYRAADEALYEAKKRGKNQFTLY